MFMNLFVVLQKFKIVKLEAEWKGGGMKQQLVKISELGQFYGGDRK